VPQAIKHDLEMRERGLVVILPECQGAALETLPAFLWQHFPTLQARVSIEHGTPVTRGRGIPWSALIGVDGKLLWSGSPSSGAKQVAALLETELKKVASGWGATPEAKKARAQLHGKRNLAEAKKVIDALADDNQEKAALQQELTAAFQWRIDGVKLLRDEGRFVEAKAAAAAAKKAVTGVAEWEAQVTPLVAAFESPEDQKELTYAKKIDGVLAGIRDKKTKVADAIKPLRAIAKSAAGTKAGERAEKLADAFGAPAKSE
jgi:hypothetical protein